MSVLSPNMNLVVSTIGVDSGLNWETNLNSSLSIIDGHNHAPGSGVQINPSGININSDLTFNNTNNAIALRSVRFAPQNSPLTGSADLGCLYVSGVDLYYNDESGNQVRITSGGTVNATSSGIASGTATAGFVSSVLVVNAATNTPANIQAASILLGNNEVNSKYLTLSPPSSLASNYNLVLPAIPGALSFLQIDTSGNITAGPAIAGGIGTSNIASQSITNNELALGLQQLTSNLGTLSTSGSVAMNCATADTFYVAASAAITITVNLSNFLDGQNATLIVNANGFAVSVVFTPASGSMQYPGGVQLAQTTGIDIYTILYTAVTGNYYLITAQDFS